MTGLDLATDALVEVACVVTDGELAVLDDGIDLIIKPPAEALDQMPDLVREMHTASGLLDELPGGMTLAEAQDQLLGYVRGHGGAPQKSPRGGSRRTEPSFLVTRVIRGRPRPQAARPAGRPRRPNRILRGDQGTVCFSEAACGGPWWA